MTSSNNLLATTSIVVTEVYEVKFGVGKIHTLVYNVQCQTIGPIYFSAYNGGTVSTIHTNTFNSRILSPVGPKQPACSKTFIIYVKCIYFF